MSSNNRCPHGFELDAGCPACRSLSEAFANGQAAMNIVNLIDERMGKGWTRSLASALWPSIRVAATEDQPSDGWYVGATFEYSHKVFDSDGDFLVCDCGNTTAGQARAKLIVEQANARRRSAAKDATESAK
jgi:hypothetical protein